VSARAIELRVRHGESGAEETRNITLVGYAGARIPTEYASALLLVGVALAVLLLLVLPGPAALGALEQRFASRLRAVSTRQIVRSIFGDGPRVVASIMGSILVGTFALGPYVLAPDTDGALMLVASLGMIAASRIAAAHGFRASIRAAGAIALLGAMLAASLAGMVVLEGAFQLGELVRRQGAMPWELAAARWPAAAVLALPYLGALFALSRRHEEKQTASVEILDRLGILLACALAVAVFFGGWQLPGLLATRSLALHLLAAVVFVAKTWALVAVLRSAVAVATPWTTTEARGFFVRRMLPCLAVGLGLALLSRRLAPGSAFEGAFGATAAAAAGLIALRSALRVRDAMIRPEPHASPFL
jgi:NADH-quinone oxidoreductase subunit H